MELMVRKMRADWMVVAEDRKASGEWTAEIEQQVGDAVRGAIEGGKADLVTLWARWLSDLSASTIAFRAITVSVDLRMREQARRQREEQQKGV